MILIDDVEIKTVLDGMSWQGAKDIVTRQLNFSYLCNPLKKEIPVYKANVGSKVEWRENDKTLFLGYIETMPYNTDEDTINITCQDLMTRLVRSTFIGRMKGTLNEIANNICGIFGIKNGLNSDSTHIHNIVSDGDLTYYDVLKTACDALFDRYTLYMDGDTLRFAERQLVDTLEIGVNIRGSQFTQSMSDMVTRVLVIDNEGKVLDAVENTEDLQKYGLFQTTYNYNKDSKNNLAEARKLLKGVTNEGAIVANNNNACISGRFIEIHEPVNGFDGIFEITSDNHTIGTNSEMTLEVSSFIGAIKGRIIENIEEVGKQVNNMPKTRSWQEEAMERLNKESEELEKQIQEELKKQQEKSKGQSTDLEVMSEMWGF